MPATTTPTAEEAPAMTTTTTHGSECSGCRQAVREARRLRAAMPAVCGATLVLEGKTHEARLGA